MGMKKRIFMIIKFICNEIIIKYIFCYILFGISLIIACSVELPEIWENWLISFSASMFSMPVIFVFYTIYNNALNRKTTIKVSYKLDNEINNIFACFIFFTQYFYKRLGADLNLSEDEINCILNYKKEEIFHKVSDNIFSGIVLFSEFDTFDTHVFDVVNQPIIAKYADKREVALLFEFINSFRCFRNIFQLINSNEYIVCGKCERIEIEESTVFKNKEGKKFYDIKKLNADGSYSSFYSAMYPIYEKDKLLLEFKLSGNKSKEISEALFELYQCINRWLNYCGKNRIEFSNSFVVGGRLHIDANLTFNEFMDENIAFSSQF